MNGRVDLSCAKKIIVGDPTLRQCGSDLEYNLGLCYKPCGKGYDAVGPVCWGQPPRGWVQCGFGAARDDRKCAEATVNQVVSVGTLFSKIKKIAGESAGKVVKKTPKHGELVENMKKLKSMASAAEKLPSALQRKAKEWIQKNGNSDFETMEPEDLIRLAADFAAIFDVTGIADVVAAYTFPLCSKIKG